MFCPHCGNTAEEGQAFCGHCGMRLAGQEAAAGEAPGGRRPTPWEDRATNGFFGGLFSAIKRVLFNPTDFFRTMPVTGGLTDPLLFALIIGMVGLMFSYTWQILLHSSMQGMLPPELSMSGSRMFEGVTIAVLAIFSPLLLIIGVFVGAGFLHLLLLLVRGASAGFEATFRVVCYSFGPNLLLIIPFCGGALASLWALVITIIGLREAHGTSGGKAAFAVLFPLILCCGVIALFTVLFMGALAASFGMMQQ